MSERYDVVVVGAGMGGLAAAARLLQEGSSVLVVDRDPHPGGTAYIYRRKEFGFPMGPMGLSNPELVGGILEKLGVEEELSFRRVDYRLMAFGLEAPLSLPYREMITELAHLFPGEEAGISRFFGHMESISRRQADLGRSGPTRFRKSETLSAAVYLDGLVKDGRLRRILGSIGSREPYSGLPLLAAMWDLLCGKGIHYPVRGMQHFVDALAERAGGRGGKGRLSLNTDVASIVVEGGKARGVVLADGTTIDSGAVISNADYKATFLGLVPREALPPDFHRAVSGARQTSSNLQVTLGLDASRVDLCAFDRSSRIIYRAGADLPAGEEGPDWSATEIDPHALAGEELEFCLLSADDPTLAPSGREVLVIRVSADHGHFTHFRPGWRKRSPAYRAYKERLARALVREASSLMPGLEQAALYMDVATPLTFEERGGRSGGAVAGWSWDYGDSAQAQANELILTPISGLYMAGYQAFSMISLGGIPSAVTSGLKAAEYLLDGAPPTNRIDIPV